MTSAPATKTQYPDYENKYKTTAMDSPDCNEICIFYAVANVIICVLGVAGNGLVIWITGFKVKKTVVSTWYLSLAMSDFLFCTFLPFRIVNVVRDSWMFGSFMCKFMSFIMFLNWFSSIFLLVIISVDRCVVVMFPVWAQNQRTVRRASVIVILAWIISAALSSPTIIVINNSVELESNLCFYENFEQYLAVVVCQFIFLFVIPFLIIIICYVLILRKLNSSQTARSKKPSKIMTVLIVSFLICWLPYHTDVLMTITRTYYRFRPFASVFSIVLANANSCLNPFLYAFMGKDFKNQCLAQQTTITTSERNKCSTNV